VRDGASYGVVAGVCDTSDCAVALLLLAPTATRVRERAERGRVIGNESVETARGRPTVEVEPTPAYGLHAASAA
jgi:hypothetical protein